MQTEERISCLTRTVCREFQLSDKPKQCAKEIVDKIYDIDKFARIKVLFKRNDKSVKIDTKGIKSPASENNCLRYMFIRSSSDLFESRDAVKQRAFDDREYVLNIDDEEVPCRLATDWCGYDRGYAGKSGSNYLHALVDAVNQYYTNIVEIKEVGGELHMNVTLREKFELLNLPDTFKTRLGCRYVTALLAKPFVILTGNSGTGKTRIAKQFANYLEVELEDDKKNWMIVPVGADWTDNTKVLGFYNPLANDGKGEYVKTGIIKLAERANRHPDIPFFLILDEMNLSHVERYFSDFLSCMEIKGSSFELDGYDGTLKFPDNLFVVGTVNIDETTYMFSPKVLDRANVIEFKPDSGDVLNLFVSPGDSDEVEPAPDGTAEAFLETAREIRDGQSSVMDKMEVVRETFEAVYDELEKAGMEFSYRTVKEIRQYVSATYEICEGEGPSLDELIDEQLMQKVLPKIHGNSREIGELLNELEKICNPEGKEKYPLSLKKITQMKGKLDAVQYASYI